MKEESSDLWVVPTFNADYCLRCIRGGSINYIVHGLEVKFAWGVLFWKEIEELIIFTN